MKTAVSLPDDLFRQAEAAARELRVSRSELYARAIEAFLRQKGGTAITQRLNDVYAQSAAQVDSGLQLAQLRSLEEGDW
ncbi:hypothetical protein [uncultured Paludibaculum sp.]|uniref:hypothetical protein n=1 Tax=uncultured Paludibaculum sp. TaxID=1765020 RepID=UPI002AAB3B8A|nr:hypothetical protein [uncultured Paludibaculum sp.]